VFKGIFSGFLSFPSSIFLIKKREKKNSAMSSNIIEDQKDAKHDIVVREHEEQDYRVDEYGDIRPEPTEEDWKTLREVADDIPKAAYLVILVEFCERFTYYGKIYMNIYTIITVVINHPFVNL